MRAVIQILPGRGLAGRELAQRMMTPRTRIALIDDHAVVRMGYRRLLELEVPLTIVAEFGSAQEAEAALLGAPRLAVDMALLDLSMPGRSGLDLLKQLSERRPDLKVLVISMHDTPAMVTQALRAGACGFVSKSDDPQVLVNAVLALAAGQSSLAVQEAPAHARMEEPPHHQLTPRESEVLGHLVTGASLEVIARQIGVSEKTVSNVQTLIRHKLHVGNAVELLHYARTHGLMP